MKFKVSTIILAVLLFLESIFFLFYALSPKDIPEKLPAVETDVNVYEQLRHVGYRESLKLDDPDYFLYTYKMGCPYCQKAEEKLLEFAEVGNVYVMNIEQSIIDEYEKNPHTEFEKENPDPSKHIIMSAPIMYHVVDGKIVDHYYDFEEINNFIAGYFEGMKHNN